METKKVGGIILIKNVMGLSLIFALCLGFVDFYIGIFHAELSWRTYFAFSVAYFVLVCIILTMTFITARIIRAENFNLNKALFVGCLFVFDFVIVSVKLNGWFNLLNVRSLADTSLLTLLLVIFVLSTKKAKIFRDAFFSKIFIAQVFFLTVAITEIINFFLLNFPDPPASKAEVLAYTAIIGLIPLVVFWLSIGFEKLALKALKTSRARLVAASLSFVVVIALIPALKNPTISHFFIDSTQSANRISQENSPNIIWIVLDTARRDHFSCYGYERKITPNIDNFAKDGVLFTNYISTAPWTLPSHASMFTGLYTSKHGARFVRKGALFAPLPRKVTTIAEILAQAGWQTAAISANTMLSKKNNMDQGFRFFYSRMNAFHDFFWGLLSSQISKKVVKDWGFLRVNVYKLSSSINKIVFQWLNENKKEPFFLFINYMEAHHGGKYLPGNGDGVYGVDWGMWNKMYKSLDLQAIVTKKKKIPPEKYQINRNWQDEKLAYLDRQIGKLFDYLKKMGAYDNSYIILLSDHGDLFGEHYSFGHTMELYNELIHAPLIIKYPKSMKRSGVSDKFVQTVDLMPELLSNLNIPIPPEVQGEPFAEAHHEIVSELFQRNELTLNKARYSRDLKAIFDVGNANNELYKFIQSTNGQHELYELKIDSLELHNIYPFHPKIANALDERLNTWRKSIQPIKDNDSEIKPLDKKTKDKLRALGYIK